MSRDVRLSFHGSIVLLSPETEAARDWIEAHIDTETAQFWAGALAVEPRYLDPIVEGMREDGLCIGTE
jgi:hypothetical protein